MIEISKIRREFPILSSTVNGKPLIYLDNAATTHKPIVVLKKIEEFYTRFNSNVHRGAHLLSEQANALYEGAREGVGKFINTDDPGEIIFTRGTTESINIVAQSLGSLLLGKDDEIVITEMEHHSNIVPWQMLCHRKNAHLKVIPFDESGILQSALLDHLITKRTRLIALTLVSNVLGTVNPVKALIEKAHSFGIPVLLDGAQAVQHMSIDVRNLDCDFLAFSGHKVYAETGIGVLYGKRKWLEAMPPREYGGGMISSVKFEKTTFASIPHKFEAGTPNICGAVSLKAAIDFLHEVGIGAIRTHEEKLMDYAIRRLSELEGVKIFGPLEKRCGVLAFNIGTTEPYDVMLILDKLGIAVRSGTHCAQPVADHFRVKGTVRVSFALYNTPEEIDSLVFGIEKISSLLHG